MTFKNSRKITFEEFGDLLSYELEQGNIGDDVPKLIAAGLIPIKILRDKLRWIIEREGDGLMLSSDNPLPELPKN